MESGAKGCEVIVSGKLRAQRAKAMKFKDGYMVSSGNPTRDYIDGAIRHVLLRQGVLGIKVTKPPNPKPQTPAAWLQSHVPPAAGQAACMLNPSFLPGAGVWHCRLHLPRGWTSPGPAPVSCTCQGR